MIEKMTVVLTSPICMCAVPQFTVTHDVRKKDEEKVRVSCVCGAAVEADGRKLPITVSYPR